MNLKDVAPQTGIVLALAALIVGSFLLGGSPRPEVGSLPFVRALAALLLGLGVWSLSFAQIRTHAPLVGLAAACMALPLAQLMPLPPGAANALPGHALVAAIDAQSGVGAVWRPLTLTPEATRNALWSLLVPCAALALSIQIPPLHQRRIAGLVLGLGLLSGVLALLQLQSDSGGPLYFYETTNNAAAVGLFANRNHQAVFLACLLPLLFAAADLHGTGRGRMSEGAPHRKMARHVKQAVTVSAVVFLVLLIIVTGSRSGLAMGVLGLACIPFVTSGAARSHHGAPQRLPRLFLMLSCAVIGLSVALAVWLGRAEALDRLLGTDTAGEMRIRILPTVKDVTQAFWPWGSGLGSFEKVYQVHEPAGLLMPFYMNHAHDDWLELVMTGGLPALVLVLYGVAIWLTCAVKLTFAEGADPFSALRKAGLVIMLLLGLASITDYPLRTPALACLLVLACVWAVMPLQRADAALIAIRRERS